MHCNKTASSAATSRAWRPLPPTALRIFPLAFSASPFACSFLLPAAFPAKLPRPDRARGYSHRLLKFEHELIHRLAARRLDREVARILGVAPEIAFGDELESGRLDFAA